MISISSGKYFINFTSVNTIIILINWHFIPTILSFCRYIETGCYKGFVQQYGRNLVAKELNVQTENILPWKVYTEADFKFKQAQRNCQRPAKKQGKFYVLL